MDTSQIYISVIFALMCTIAVGVTVLDKHLAIHRKRRISELTLLLVGVFTSAAAMYVTMRIIKHKTRHNKFMYGLPILFFSKIGVCAILFV